MPETLERLTWEQICERHADEWVVLASVRWTDKWHSRVVSGLVVCHGGATEDEAWERAKHLLATYPELVQTQARWTSPPWDDDLVLVEAPIETPCPDA